MAISKPTKSPRWSETTGDSGTVSNVVEPSEGKKDVGYGAAEQPPAQTCNWLFNLVYEWIRWLDAVTNPNGHSNESITALYTATQIVVGTYLNVGTDATIGHDLFAEGALYFAGEETQTLTGTTYNDYAVGARTSHFRMSGPGVPEADITGIAGGGAGRQLRVTNVGSNNVRLENQSASSAAANRVITGTGAAVDIPGDGSVLLVYDGTSSRWRLANKNF